MKLKQLFCRHKNRKETFIYDDNFRYNDFFKDVIVTREKVIFCKDCGKLLDTIHVEIVTLEKLKEEVINNV